MEALLTSRLCKCKKGYSLEAVPSRDRQIGGDLLLFLGFIPSSSPSEVDDLLSKYLNKKYLKLGCGSRGTYIARF